MLYVFEPRSVAPNGIIAFWCQSLVPMTTLIANFRAVHDDKTDKTPSGKTVFAPGFTS